MLAPGYVGGLFCFGLLFVVLAACALVCIVNFVFAVIDRNGDDKAFFGVFGTLAIALALFFFSGFVSVLTPLDMDYHRYHHIQGTVADVTPSHVEKHTEYIFSFAGKRDLYICNDARCATIKQGDRPTLNCVRSHQTVASDPYRCRFIANEATVG